MTVYFVNEGDLGLEGIFTFGLNVKPGATSIGRFGTGLKYAIATLLRNGCKISITTHEHSVTFYSVKSEFRKQEIELVNAMILKKETGTKYYRRLGITTQLGKDWELWMAYRELASNCFDEKGSVITQEVDELPKYNEYTVVQVDGMAFDQIFESRHEIFFDIQGLEDAELFKDDHVTIYDQPSKYLYYQGIRVHELPREARYTYNLTSYFTLTEDRTLANTYLPYLYICEVLLHCPEEAVFNYIKEGFPKNDDEDGWFERTLDFDEATPEADMPIVKEIQQRYVANSGAGFISSYTPRVTALANKYIASSIERPETPQEQLIKAWKAWIEWNPETLEANTELKDLIDRTIELLGK